MLTEGKRYSSPENYYFLFENKEKKSKPQKQQQKWCITSIYLSLLLWLSKDKSHHWVAFMMFLDTVWQWCDTIGKNSSERKLMKIPNDTL